MWPRLQITVNPNTYIKDPESSDLGQKILTTGIELMDELGFEVFTFKKLAERCGTTEASVYRYFESKHQMLLYLINRYWAGMEDQLAFAVANIDSAAERLSRAVKEADFTLAYKIAEQKTKAGSANNDWEISETRALEASNMARDFETLSEAEKELFDGGESSLFMVNARETAFISAEIKRLETIIKNRQAALKANQALGLLAP